MKQGQQKQVKRQEMVMAKERRIGVTKARAKKRRGFEGQEQRFRR